MKFKMKNKLIFETLEEYLKNTDRYNTFGVKIGDKDISGNVKKLIELVDDKTYPAQQFNVKELYKNSGVHDFSKMTVWDKKTNKYIPYEKLDAEKKKQANKNIQKDIMKVNLKYPILVIKDKNEYQVIDGHHRVEKAHILKHKKINGLLIPTNDLLDKFD